MGRKVRRSAGQSLVELTLLLPILMLILASVIDFARCIDAYITITNGVREGARYGSMFPDRTETIKARTANEANGAGFVITGVQLDATDITVSFPDGTQYPGSTIRVAAQYNFPLIFGGIVGLNSIHMDKVAEMVIITSPVPVPLSGILSVAGRS